MYRVYVEIVPVFYVSENLSAFGSASLFQRFLLLSPCYLIGRNQKFTSEVLSPVLSVPSFFPFPFFWCN